MPVTAADINDGWWKANMDPNWKKLWGTGVGEHLRKYESAVAALKKAKIPVPPDVPSRAVVESFRNMTNHTTLSNEATKGYKALFEVEKILDELKKKSTLPQIIDDWRVLIHHQRREVMVLADNLK